MLRVSFIILVLLSSLFSKVTIVSSNSNKYVLQGVYSLGEGETILEAKQYLIKEAKAEVINNLGSYVESRLDRYGDVSLISGKIVSPAMTKTVVSQEKRTAYQFSCLISIEVNQAKLDDMINKSKGGFEEDLFIDDSVKGLANESKVMEQSRQDDKKTKEQISKFELDRLNVKLTNAYKQNMSIKRQILSTTTKDLEYYSVERVMMGGRFPIDMTINKKEEGVLVSKLKTVITLGDEGIKQISNLGISDSLSFRSVQLDKDESAFLDGDIRLYDRKSKDYVNISCHNTTYRYTVLHDLVFESKELGLIKVLNTDCTEIWIEEYIYGDLTDDKPVKFMKVERKINQKMN